MISPTSETLYLIDGHALAYRTYFALTGSGFSGTSRSGEPTSAVFGFTSTLIKSITDIQPSHIAVAFDLPGPTIRSEIYPDYKAQRPPMPDELRQQLSRIREVVEKFGISIYESPGYEADDVLGTLAQQADAHGMHTTILSLKDWRSCLHWLATAPWIYLAREGLACAPPRSCWTITVILNQYWRRVGRFQGVEVERFRMRKKP